MQTAVTVRFWQQDMQNTRQIFMKNKVACKSTTLNQHRVDEPYKSQVNAKILLKEFVKIPQQVGLKSVPNHFSEDRLHQLQNAVFAKYRKELWAVSQNDWNESHGLDLQTVKRLRDILTKSETADDYTLSPEGVTDNYVVGNFPKDLNEKEHSTRSQPDFRSSVAVTSQLTLTNILKEHDKRQIKEEKIEFFENWKGNLQQKIQESQIDHLLLVKHQGLTDIREISRIAEMEAQIVSKRLNCKDWWDSGNTERLKHIFVDQEKLLVAKGSNEHHVKQLQALLDKYERLKKRTGLIKKQLLEERIARKRSQKASQMVAALLLNQATLNEIESAQRVQSVENKNVQTIDMDFDEYIYTIQTLEAEKMFMQAEFGNLKEQLHKTLGQNKTLVQEVQFNELQKIKILKNLHDSKKLVTQLCEKLDQSERQRESIHKQFVATKSDLKEIHSRCKMKILKLQEQQKFHVDQFETKRLRLQRDCKALTEVVAKLKADKKLIKEELQRLQREKGHLEAESKREGEKLRQTVNMLECERKLLLEEMEDLRKDYISLSDRITHRLGQLDCSDRPMCIIDISPDFPQKKAMDGNMACQISSNTDMIEHIRRKLELEEFIQHS